MGTHSSETTRVNNSRSTMIRTLALVAVLVSAVHSYDHTCVTNEACKMVSDGVDCSGDCGCGDNMADECGRPHPTTAVHVDTITDCMANCQVFALEQRCKFIIFHYDNIDENCIIMNDDFESYIGHCNRRGQALWGNTKQAGKTRWSNCKNSNECNNDITGVCTSCQDCKMDPCSGFMLSQCATDSLPLETDDNNSGWSQCEQFAWIQKKTLPLRCSTWNSPTVRFTEAPTTTTTSCTKGSAGTASRPWSSSAQIPSHAEEDDKIFFTILLTVLII